MTFSFKSKLGGHYSKAASIGASTVFGWTVGRYISEMFLSLIFLLVRIYFIVSNNRAQTYVPIIYIYIFKGYLVDFDSLVESLIENPSMMMKKNQADGKDDSNSDDEVDDNDLRYC